MTTTEIIAIITAIGGSTFLGSLITAWIERGNKKKQQELDYTDRVTDAALKLVDPLTRRVEQLELEKDETEKEIKSLKEGKQDLECKISALQAQISELQRSVQTRDSRISQLEATIGQKDLRIMELEKRVFELESEVAYLRTENERLKN